MSARMSAGVVADDLRRAIAAMDAASNALALSREQLARRLHPSSPAPVSPPATVERTGPRPAVSDARRRGAAGDHTPKTGPPARAATRTGDTTASNQGA